MIHYSILVQIFAVPTFMLLFCYQTVFSIHVQDVEQRTDSGSSSFLLPTIQIVMLIHPFNKVAYLPYTLGSIEFQHYPKDRIRIHFITERIFYEESLYDSTSTGQTNIFVDNSERDFILDERLRQNDLTIEILKRWTRHNRDVYNDIELSISNLRLAENDGKNYWNKDRFRLIIDTKNQELFNAFRSWSDFVLFFDSDVILTNRFMFQNLTHLERIKDLVIVAPMLNSFGTYSNFWAGMDEKGYYVRTDDYLPILQRKQTGTFSVPMVHSCFFIDTRRKQSRLLTFDPLDVIQSFKSLSKNEPPKIPFDDIIAFAKSASFNHVKLYVNNAHEWGFISPPITEENSFASEDVDRVNILDLHLDSLVEGVGFPVSPSLESYILPPEQSDSLGVDRVYIINLYRRPERRLRMIKSLKLLGIEAQIWNATDGKLLTNEYLDKHEIKSLTGYVDPYHKRPMTFGEIGCFLSHYRIWEDAFRNDYSKIIILEDDVRFEHNFRSQWADALDRFNQFDENEYDFLYIGRKLNGDYEDEVVVDDMFVRPGYSYWTIGYMLTSSGVRKLLHANPIGRMVPVDEFLPIMYGSHPNESLLEEFASAEPLRAISLRHLLVSPTHYVGDSQYVSDTEDSDKISLTTEKNSKVDNSQVETLSEQTDYQHRVNTGQQIKNQQFSEQVVSENSNEKTTSSNGFQPPPSTLLSTKYLMDQHLEL